MTSKLVPDVVATYVLLHAACLLAFVTGISWFDVELLATAYAIRMLGVGIVYHRYFSHRAFKTSRVLQAVFALWGVLSLQKGPLWWAATHRHHHRHADTPRDLHSPSLQGAFYAHFVWFQLRDNNAVVPPADLWRFRELRVIDDWRFYFAFNLASWAALGWAFGLAGVVYGAVLPTVLCLQMSHLIQSVSHAAGGYRRFASRDHSRNHVWIGVLSLGEWHNNHHFAMSSARQGVAWWELDVQWLVLRALAALGLVWDLRLPAHHAPDAVAVGVTDR
jgi:stearoyl-CoA desaturase (delta-9 desaturase)|nr:fatty acid desaturase [Kofleriaceae bacterium]